MNGSSGSGAVGKLGTALSRESTAKHYSFRLTGSKVPGFHALLEELRDAESLQRGRFQLEKGENGQEHYQGIMSFTKKVRRNNARKILQDIATEELKFPGIDYCEKTRNIAGADRYVMKEDTRIAGPWEFGDFPQTDDVIRVREPEHQWEFEILNILKEPADLRVIYWYWEPVGNVGKTSFAKYLCVKHGAIMIGGSAADMMYAVAASKIKPKICVMNFAMDTNINRIDYTGLESVKDGVFFSSKYESGMVLFNQPHLIVFANAPPRMDKMGAARWDIREIRILPAAGL